MDFEKLLQLLRALQACEVDYILVGGAALGMHGLVRATEDVDIFVRPESENIERLRRALCSVWNDPEIEQITAQDLAGDYPTVRYVPPDGSLPVDLISHLGSEVRFEDLEAQTIVLEGVSVRTATPRTLYRMKKDTIRPIDRADAAALRQKFGLEDA